MTLLDSGGSTSRAHESARWKISPRRDARSGLRNAGSLSRRRERAGVREGRKGWLPFTKGENQRSCLLLGALQGFQTLHQLLDGVLLRTDGVVLVKGVEGELFHFL